MSNIQRKAASHFCQDMDASTKSDKLSEWFDSDYDERLDMMNLDHVITSFVCVVYNYVTVVKGITISQDFSESWCKVYSGYVGVPCNYNVFSLSAKNGTWLEMS